MNPRSVRSLLVGSVVMLSLPVAMSAESRPSVPGNVEILVNGIAQPRLEHNGRLYVEAFKGREYAIRIRNPYPVRVGVALSVDGLNTIDARQTTAADARKWVLDPYAMVTISGWQTSRTEARRFEFTTEEKSYGQALGKVNNLGVISAVFFREKTAHVARDTRESAGRQADAPAPSSAPTPALPAEESSAAIEKSRADNEYAATGMGRRTDHSVTQVWLDLESRPSLAMDIRYEFRPQLVRLGILPAETPVDPLKRRERARGFEDAFSPVPFHLR